MTETDITVHKYGIIKCIIHAMWNKNIIYVSNNNENKP